MHIFWELQPKLKRAELFPGDVVLRFSYEGDWAVRSAAKEKGLARIWLHWANRCSAVSRARSRGIAFCRNK